jgi:hypothetical protein
MKIAPRHANEFAFIVYNSVRCAYVIWASIAVFCSPAGGGWV